MNKISRFSGLHWWLSGKESSGKCRKHGFDPWSRKIPPTVDQACMPQLLSLRSRAWEPKLLSPHVTTTETCAPRTHALQQEKPQQWKVCTQQLEKGLAQQPVQPNMYVSRNRKSFKVQDAKFTYLFYLRNKLRSIVRHQTPGTGQQSCGESGVLEHCWWECK